MTRTLAVLLCGIAIALSCSIDRASDAYTCETTADCGPARTCEDGFCVLPPGSGNCDPDIQECFFDCTSPDPANCMQIVCPADFDCRIDCGGTNACGDIVCQTGSSCRITCGGTNACNNVTCRPGADCDVACSGTDACEAIACGAGGACDVACEGTAACGPIDCRSSCSCDVTCASDDECGTMMCPVGLGALACVVPGGECSSGGPGCDTCLP